MSKILEICVSTPESLIAAYKGGAHRIELCSALSEGGVTPSYGAIKEALKIPHLKVNILIRPRGGDFIYSSIEINQMVADIEMAKNCGANGIVIGALKPNGEVDIDTMSRFISAADGLDITFHRAFDLCASPYKSLETIIELGCNRLLTSGKSSSALKGAELIKELIKIANGRITIMPGGGVNADNIVQLASLTNAQEFHASATTIKESSMIYRLPGVSMGSPNNNEYTRIESDINRVKALADALKLID